MTEKEILRARLHFQKLDQPAFKKPGEMVKYFGAVQAQDFLGSLWAIGQRVADSTEQSVEEAIDNKKIVRSWPMRGTIHFTAPEDLRWMLDLLGPRAIAKSVTYQRDAGLTEKDFTKSRSIFEKDLQGKVLDRNEIYALLEKRGIDTSNTRGLHIIGQLAREKVICFGPRKGKQPTFVLLDDWIPKKKELKRDQALAELASRYFTSHGPATVYDFAWWSGMTITDAVHALDIVGKKLQKVVVDDKELWMSPEAVPAPRPNVRFLSAYDEFLVSYQNRSDVDSIFTSTVIVNGRIVGEWKRSIGTKGVTIKIKKIEKLSKQAEEGIKKEMKRYSEFIGMKLLS